MLEPQIRKLLFDSLAPPPGCRLDWAVGTTYSLDLIALLAAPVAFAFADWQDQDGKPVVDPLALLKATRQYADRILLFHQAGRIHVPASYQPLLTTLESSIADAVAPLGGSFHPKVWFLRFVDEDDAVSYRFLCLSRNMTFDRSWDTMLSLEGSLSNRKKAIARNHPLGKFVESLPALHKRALSPVWSERLTQLANEIRRVDFQCPASFDDIAFWPLGFDWCKPFDFPSDSRAILAISPFVDAGFVKDYVVAHDAAVQLLSRPESLDCLPGDTLQSFDKLWVLDETAEPEASDPEPVTSSADEQRADTDETRDATSPLLGLHAKAYIVDGGWNSHVWTGSANATRAAFTKNVEVLVELIGKKSRCGTEAILDRRENGPVAHPASLADLLKPYQRGDETDETKEKRTFERAVDRLARNLVDCAPVALCEDISTGDYGLVVKPTRTSRVVVPKGAVLRVWPMSLSADQASGIAFETDEWCRFSCVSLLGLTSFFVWEVHSEELDHSVRFVLNIPLVNAPENRNECLLRHLLSDKTKVLRFLLLLLSDFDASEFSKFFTTTGKHDGENGILAHGLSESTLFESLLRALDRSPEHIDQVEQIIADLQQTPEGRELLPEDLDAIWGPILEVRRRTRSGVRTDS